MDVLAGLNPAQKEAVESIEGPILILAGPGSGKTRVITQRVAYLINVCRISPYRILAVTFTNKAAKEMTERLQGLVSGSINNLTMGTFHAICARILRQDGKESGIEPGFVIYDEDDQAGLIKRALQELNLDPKKFVPKAILSAISASKSNMLYPKDCAQGSRSYFEEVVGRVYSRYQKLLEESHALDFDDLLMRTVTLLRNYPDVLKKYQERYVHVMVDEFQDTNVTQYELVKLIAGKYKNICVVGDPDQSIYSWRFADLRNILNFEKDYPNAKVLYLEENYRSTGRILETASHVIQPNQHRKPKELWTKNQAGELTNVVETYTEQEEAQYIVKEIERLVEAKEAKLGDCAVMYRTNAQSRVIEEAFVRYGTPYKLVAGTRFYERREIKDVIAYLRLISNPYDSVSLARIINIPVRGIGQHSIDELAAYASSLAISQFEVLLKISNGQVSPAELPFNPRTVKSLTGFAHLLKELVDRSQDTRILDLFDIVVAKSGYKDFILNYEDGDERWDNVMELRTVSEKYRDLAPKEGLSAFLEDIALISDVDNFKESEDKVTLITLHQAKGLEFGVVFIAGVEEGLLPHFRSLDDPYQMEEERRLCYVGITRAKRRIYLVHAFRRNLMGRSTVNKASRFLQDIPKNLVAGGNFWQAAQSHLGSDFAPAQTKSQAPQITQGPPSPGLKTGDRVCHPLFGEGVIISSASRKDDIEVTVAFTGTGVKKLLLSFAKLEKII
jgi:DNA helicase II / ATP-dependent DNA helicase PcrA